MPNLESTRKNSQCKVTTFKSSVRNTTWEFLEHIPTSEHQTITTPQTFMCFSACLHEGCYNRRAYFKKLILLSYHHFRKDECISEYKQQQDSTHFILTLRSIGAKPTVSSSFLFSELWAGLSQSYSTSGLDKSRQNVQIHSPLKTRQTHWSQRL